VPIRARLPRLLLWTGLLCGGVVAVAGGLALRGPEFVAVGVAGVLAGCMTAGIARETPGAHRRSTIEAAATAGAATVLALLGLAGIAALAGGAVATLTLVVGVLATLAARVALSRRAAGPVGRRSAPVASHGPGADRPVAVLSTAELGQEWLRTTQVLACPLEPAARQAIVLRRQQSLDELERRDPAGFERWLLTGPAPGSDPAEFVRGGPASERPLQGDPAADTDAA
jgi:hypothetical protein